MFESILCSPTAHRVIPVELLEAATVSAGCSDRDLVDALTALSQIESRVAAQKATVINELARRQPRVAAAGLEPVTRPVQEQVAAALGVSCRSAQIEVGCAELLGSRPAVLAALADGVVTTRVAHAIVDTTLNLTPEQIDVVEAEVMDYATSHTPPEVKRRINRLLHARYPDAQEQQHEEAAVNRSVTMRPDQHGMALIEALLPCYEANLVYGYLSRAADELKANDREQLKSAGLPTNDLASRATYRADALVALAAAHWAGVGVIGGTPSAKAPRADVPSTSGTVSDLTRTGATPAFDTIAPRIAAPGTAGMGTTDIGTTGTCGSAGTTVAIGIGGAVEDGVDTVIDLRELHRTRAGNGVAIGQSVAMGQVTSVEPPASIERSVVVAGEALVEHLVGAGTIAHVVLDLQTALGLADNAGELQGFGPIPGSLARELATNASWQRWIADDHSNLINIGTSRYRPTPLMRKFITARDRKCRFPGCHQPAQRCDIDHAIAYHKGGATEPGNLGALCRRHHRLKGECGWDILESHADGSCIWLTPTGERVHKGTEPVLPKYVYPNDGDDIPTFKITPQPMDPDSQRRLDETGIPF